MTMDIAVTGLSAISAAGVGLEALREALASARSCLTRVPPEQGGREGELWGKAGSFRAADFMPPIKARRFDRCSLFAVAAAGAALRAAGLENALAPEDIGICLGSGFGGIDNSAQFLTGYFRNGVEGLAPMLFPNTVPNAPASNASIELGLKGPNVTFVQRFCSAESALLTSCRFLEEGRARVMVTGGVDEVTELMLRGFRAMGQLSRHARSFGEGAGMLVLEQRAAAQARGAEPVAVVREVRTVGRLLPGREAEGLERLRGCGDFAAVSLSGSAGDDALIRTVIPPATRLVEVAPLVGRSLAMGGISLAALLLSLAPGERGLHLAASPEGPFYAIEVEGCRRC